MINSDLLRLQKHPAASLVVQWLRLRATTKRYHVPQLKMKKKRTHVLQLRLRTSQKKCIYICMYIYLFKYHFSIKRGNTLRNRNQNKLAKAKSTPKTNSERETRVVAQKLCRRAEASPVTPLRLNRECRGGNCSGQEKNHLQHTR